MPPPADPVIGSSSAEDVVEGLPVVSTEAEVLED
jgi:hypothetical protein